MIINILTTLTFVVHVVLGCCTHHAHTATQFAVDQHSNQLAQPLAETRTCCAHHHAHSVDFPPLDHKASSQNGDRDKGSPPRDCHPESCSDSHCWFAADRSVTPKSLPSLLPLFAADCLFVPSDEVNEQHSIRSSTQIADAFCVQAPQLRAQLSSWQI